VLRASGLAASLVDSLRDRVPVALRPRPQGGASRMAGGHVRPGREGRRGMEWLGLLGAHRCGAGKAQGVRDQVLAARSRRLPGIRGGDRGRGPGRAPTPIPRSYGRGTGRRAHRSTLPGLLCGARPGGAAAWRVLRAAGCARARWPRRPVGLECRSGTCSTWRSPVPLGAAWSR
jgi:hypothetical protein